MITEITGWAGSTTGRGGAWPGIVGCSTTSCTCTTP